MDAYYEWGKLFTDEVGEIWLKEKGEFKTSSMVLFVLRRELKNLLNNIEKEYDCIKEKYKECKKAAIKDENKLIAGHENTLNIKSESTLTEHDGNTSSDDTVCPSPKITRKKNFKRSRFEKLLNDPIEGTAKMKLDFNESTCISLLDSPSSSNPSSQCLSPCVDDMIDCSVINGTPNINISTKKGRTVLESSKKRGNLKVNNAKRKVNKNNNINNSNSKNNSTKVNTLTQMFFTAKDMALQEKCQLDLTSSSNKSTSPLNEVSNTLNSPLKKNIKETKKIVCMDPVVRGKERMKLEGWDCDECRKFYSGLDLNTQQTKELMNKCSKHRAMRQPIDNTIPGFWSIEFTQSQPKKDEKTRIDSRKVGTDSNKTEQSTFFQF